MRTMLAFGALGGATRALPRSCSRPSFIPCTINAMQRPALRRTAIQSYQDHQNDGAVAVTFVLQREVCFGQNMLLTGDCDELGGWDLGRAPRMEWSEGRNGEHHWSTTVMLPKGANVEYKFVIDDPRHPALWESCWNRKLIVSSSTELYGYWNQPMEDDGGGRAEDSTFASDFSTSAYSSSAATCLVNGKVKLSAAAEATISGYIAQTEVTADVAAPPMVGATAMNGSSHKINGWANSRSRSPAPTPLSGAGLSPDQQAFLERKAAKVRDAASAMAQLKGASPVPPGLSPEQLEFLERKRREASASLTTQPTRGHSPALARGRSPAPVRASTSRSRSPALASLSAEQRAFLQRKEREASRSPAPTHGHSQSPASVSSAAAIGLTPDQQAFLERKRQHSASLTPPPSRHRSSAATPVSSITGLTPDQQAFLERKQQHGISPAPAPVTGTAPTVDLSPEQHAFLEHRRQASASPAPAPTHVRSQPPFPEHASSSCASSSRSRSPALASLSAEQRAFLERKEREASRSPAPTHGHSQSPAPVGLSVEQVAFLKRSGKL